MPSGLFKRMSSKAGLSPGTLVHIGSKRIEKPKITIIDYTEKHHEKKIAKSYEECFRYKSKRSTTWINVDGLHDTEMIEAIGKHFGIHPLVLEDIVNTGQRPKTEDFGDYLFIVMKMLHASGKGGGTRTEQVSLVMGKGFVLSFQETEGDMFDGVRRRIEKGKGRIRKAGSDYLAYALLDAVVDSYFVVLEGLGDTIEGLEEELVAEADPKTLKSIYTMKREMIFLRRSIWPVREVVSGMERSGSHLVEEKTMVYLRDVYDHTIQVMDTVESLRDMVSGMLDLYLSSVSNRMNQVMKVLTIISTIFIPLSFLAGLYGMNFDTSFPLNMPELKNPYGYPALLLLMACIGITMLLYFRNKRWL